MRYLIFEKLKFSSVDCVQSGTTRHPADLFWQLLGQLEWLHEKGEWKFNRFNSGRPPSWIFITLNFKLPIRLIASVCVTHIKFGADRSNRCRDIAVFRFYKISAVRHLGFSKVRNFNCRYGSEGQCASPYQISCRSVTLLQRWRPSAILDLFYACLGHPRSILGGLYRFAKFGWNQPRNFEYMRVLMLCEFDFKMPIHAFWGFWG